MNDRDELLARLRELRREAEEIKQRTNQIIAEEEGERRRRWTPRVIRGGLASVAIAWIADHLAPRPVTAAVTALSASGALAITLAPVVTTPPQARPGRAPTIERSEAPPSTTSTQTLSRERDRVEPARRPRPATARTPTPATSTAAPPAVKPGQPTRPPDVSTTAPPSAAQCVVHLGAAELLELCLIDRDRRSLQSPLSPAS